jgi:hypothetical protein
MADAYLAISEVATDEFMRQRLRAAATQQSQLGNAPLITDPLTWVDQNRYVWASSPDWGAAWDSALAAHPDDPAYEPGKDPAVITDGQILATVQTLGGPAEPPA